MVDSKFCVFALLLFSVCYGQDSKNFPQEPTLKDHSNSVEVKYATNTTLTTPLLQNDTTNIYYSDYKYNNSTERGLSIGGSIVLLLLFSCCIYYCCRCRTQRNQGVVLGLQRPPPLPAPATQIFIQQPATPSQSAMTGVPPPYPPQQHAPPPYDTQPVWSNPPSQQQFHKQAPPSQQQFHQQPPQQYHQQPPQQYHQQPPEQYHQQLPQQYYQQPPEQQFDQQEPTSFANPNYGQPPVNPKY